MQQDFSELLKGATTKLLVGLQANDESNQTGVAKKVQYLVNRSNDIASLVDELTAIGNAALLLFIQANVTGPPLELPFDLIPAESLLPRPLKRSEDITKELAAWLSVDGEAVYQSIPRLELFVFAKIILNSKILKETTDLLWAQVRVNAWHQRLLSLPAPSLQAEIEKTLNELERLLNPDATTKPDEIAAFFLEFSAIETLHGQDIKARKHLKLAAETRKFEFALTGKLGKRTRYQEKDTSQLVILAKSHESQDEAPPTQNRNQAIANEVKKPSQPPNLDLRDDTLLESISFTQNEETPSSSQQRTPLSPALSLLDPSNQPILNPLDSIILLGTASSITNESPQDGLTREETLPFAERVLSGGSSNWQIYTQALLVRSRIEGFKSRTVERGVLQLQALVDQILAETDSTDQKDQIPQSTFLPRPTPSESAPASERLKYIHQIASPFRWKLEVELAERWISLGAVRSALDIYERLQMWAEVALCMAASGREDAALKVLRRQLCLSPDKISLEQSSNSTKEVKSESLGVLRENLPLDAPRLLCILGDLEQSSSAYEKAWEISYHRYARAQRSLGKYYTGKRDLQKADEAYTKSLSISPQNHATWFALGSIRIQIEDWLGAIEAFRRAIQIADDDAESWSNMAVAFLNLKEQESTQHNLKAAFTAMKRSTSLKRENFKLWQNLLAVAIKLSPPPYEDIIIAQARLIDLLGPSKGEAAVDVPVVEALLVAAFGDGQSLQEHDGSDERGIRNMVINLLLQKVSPLVTSSRPLWMLIANLNIRLNRPFAALSTYEKAWRSALNQAAWESTYTLWENVADATVDLIDAYESFGERERESGLGAGELVCKDWRFKARSAARSVLARAKDAWEDDEAYKRLNDRLEDLKANR